MARVEFDGEKFDVPIKLLRVYQDLTIRQATNTVLSPLKSPGIERFEIREDTKVIESISRDELPLFDVPEIEEEEIVSDKRRAAFSIVSLAFKEDNKWRLYDGNNTFYVTIKDKEFLNKVESNMVSFRKDDILICDVEVKSWSTSEGLKTEYNITKVVDHKSAMRQIPLQLDAKNDDES